MQIQTGYNQTSLTQILSAEPAEVEWDALHTILQNMVSLEKNLIEFIKEGSAEEMGIYANAVAIQGTLSEIVLQITARTTKVDNYHLHKSSSN